MESKRPTPYRWFTGYVVRADQERVFFITTDDYIGLAPSTIKARDHICVLLGCRTPLVLGTGRA